MAGRRRLGRNVLDVAIERMVRVYEAGHRVIVSFSAGKDSGICLEVCLIAARKTGRLPIEVMMRDEEIMFPGTFEYAERVMRREDIVFHWYTARQPVVNICNRAAPYFWVFDPLLDSSQWMRPMPSWIEEIGSKNIDHIVIPERFPLKTGQKLINVMGLRGSESTGRRLGIFSSKGYMTQENRFGVAHCRPIYDWLDGDVWKAIKDHGWDYNMAYDAFMRMGMKRYRIRIAPPTLIIYGIEMLQMSAKIWPRWFDRLSDRLPGVRLAANYGARALRPLKRVTESWEECYERECVRDAPSWIAARANVIREKILRGHSVHSSIPFPQVKPCIHCTIGIRSWSTLARVAYSGDPFSLKLTTLPYIEPEFFREGAGVWGGSPTFT